MKATIQSVSDLLASPKGTLLPKEVAAVLGVDLRTVYGAIDEGQIEAIKVGRLRLIPKAVIVKMLHLDDADDTTHGDDANAA